MSNRMMIGSRIARIVLVTAMLFLASGSSHTVFVAATAEQSEEIREALSSYGRRLSKLSQFFKLLEQTRQRKEAQRARQREKKLERLRAKTDEPSSSPSEMPSLAPSKAPSTSPSQEPAKTQNRRQRKRQKRKRNIDSTWGALGKKSQGGNNSQQQERKNQRAQQQEKRNNGKQRKNNQSNSNNNRTGQQQARATATSGNQQTDGNANGNMRQKMVNMQKMNMRTAAMNQKNKPTAQRPQELKFSPDSPSPELQPKVVDIEGGLQRRVIGLIALPRGSPWCPATQPTLWPVGHENPEFPWCFDKDAREGKGEWKNSSHVVLDVRDELNNPDGRRKIDRHDCVAIDVNGDDLLDVVCMVGASKGTGEGYNELYLTQPNGTLEKEMYHGLQRFKSQSTRLSAVLTHGPTKRKMVFVGTNGRARADGRVRPGFIVRTGPVGEAHIISSVFFVPYHFSTQCHFCSSIRTECFAIFSPTRVHILKKSKVRGYSHFR